MPLIKVDPAYIKILPLHECIKNGYLEEEELEYTRVYREDEEELKKLIGSTKYGGLLARGIEIKLSDIHTHYSLAFVAIDNVEEVEHEGEWVILACPSGDRDALNKRVKIYKKLAEIKEAINIPTMVEEEALFELVLESKPDVQTFKNVYEKFFFSVQPLSKEALTFDRSSLIEWFLENNLEVPSSRNLNRIFPLPGSIAKKD